MSFTWPLMLAAILVAPLLFLLAWAIRRRRKRDAVRVPSLAPIAVASSAGPRWRRRIPAALLLLGLATAAVGVARPQATVEVASSESTIILALDVSRSMCSTDVDPNRLVAAQEAASSFVDSLPAGTQVGLVAFSSVAGLIVAPTDDTDEVTEAIDGLTTSRGTAIGAAILASIDAIAEINPDVAATGIDATASEGSGDEEVELQPETIVVLTDGSNSEGVDPVTAAEQAAARGLRVYTIGFGTTEAASSVCTADQIDQDSASGQDSPGGGGGGGGQQIDEETLESVAELTGAEYFRATDADQLTDVLGDLPATISVTTEDVEISAWFTASGATLVTIGLGLSLWWNRVRRSRERS
ncbi:MAG: VWA domain-containing protein [Microbacterium sp.]|uniref:VWA domain-containing protein n=1 Tax=Microbacterium sp. TaxID=51671 RepID=UPI0039E44722